MTDLTAGCTRTGPHPATRTEAQAREDIRQRRLHIRALPDEAVPSGHPQACFAVIQRENGHWSTAAQIRSTHETEPEAEQEAARLKIIWPEQAFGVFSLRSEAVPTQKPVEIARVSP